MTAPLPSTSDHSRTSHSSVSVEDEGELTVRSVIKTLETSSSPNLNGSPHPSPQGTIPPPRDSTMDTSESSRSTSHESSSSSAFPNVSPSSLTSPPHPRHPPPCLSRNVAKVIKGEIHNVWIVMRTDMRYASPLRFTQELPVDEHPLLNSLRELHDRLGLWEQQQLQQQQQQDDKQHEDEEEHEHEHHSDSLDVTTYLAPFCEAVVSSDISAPITGAALSALHKFMLYGFLSQSVDGMKLLAKSLMACTFEESQPHVGAGAASSTSPSSLHHQHKAPSSRLSLVGLTSPSSPSLSVHTSTNSPSSSSSAWSEDEQVVLKLLNLAALVVRTSLEYHPYYTDHQEQEQQQQKQQHATTTPSSPPPPPLPLLDTDLIVGLLDTCLHVSHKAKRASALLKSAAADALGQMVLVVFHTPHAADARSSILLQLSRLTNPSQPNTLSDPTTCVITSLTLLNIALETMPPEGATEQEIDTIQNDLCKHLLQLSTTHDLVILGLTLRVIFNLFQLSIRNQLKVPLEIFLTSVHVRILDSPQSSYEQAEVALESLLEFCREPALMQDLYLNYDCDVQCTNLFATIAATLGSMAGGGGGGLDGGGGENDASEQQQQDSKKPLNALNRLALEGILHIVDSIARRCKHTTLTTTSTKTNLSPLKNEAATNNSNLLQRSGSSRLTSEEVISETSSHHQNHHQNHQNNNDALLLDDLGDRWQAEETHKMLQERKRRKDLLSQAAKEFNRCHPEILHVLEDLELTGRPASPEEVASFLYTTPHLDKALIGLYLSKGPAEEYPFHAKVRTAFVGLFDFTGMDFAEALRTLLSRFRLPGEAQCIDRLMEAFAEELFLQQQQQQQDQEGGEEELGGDDDEEEEDPEDAESQDNNKKKKKKKNQSGGGNGTSLFRSADAAFTLAFSTILLNTDLHNPTIKDERRMTLEQFIRNNRGINDGEDFPEDFLTELYEHIKAQEIQVRRELLDVVRRHALEDGGEIPAKHWSKILSSKAQDVAKPMFTPAEQARRNDFQAGVHERDMFLSISKSAIQSISSIFVRSSDDALVIKALRGFKQMAQICVYFHLDEPFNEILQILLGHGRDYIMSCIALEYAGYDSEQIMASGPSSSKVDDDDSQPHAAIPTTLVTTKAGDDASDDAADAVTGIAAHRGLVSLDIGLTLVRHHSTRIREAWPMLIECLCALRDARALPDRVIFLDDFADSQGNLLPLSPFAKQSQRRLDGYYRSLSEGDPSKSQSWFHFPSLFKKDTKSGLDDGQDGGGSSTSSERELSSFSHSLLEVTRRARLEEAVLMRPQNLPMAKQIISALLDSIDSYPYFDDPLYEQHAVYSLELALLALISNKDRVQELFPIFLSKFETVLQTPAEDPNNPEANAHMPTPFLMERVVVTILRSCIHLYDFPEVRADLFKSLRLLIGLPTKFTRFVSDRISCGMAIFLSQKFSLLETSEEWNFISDMLDRLAHFGAGRGFVFDGIANTVESQLVAPSPREEERAVLSLEGSSVITKLLLRFIFGKYQNDMNLTVPAMLCLENLYRHVALLKRSAEVPSKKDDGSVEPVPDLELWQNVVVAFYSVCRSPDASISREGTDCFQRFIASTPVESLPDEKWIDILYLVVNKQPPLSAHEARVNTCTILGKALLMTIGPLSKVDENWEDLTDIVTQFAVVVGENLREGRKGSVSPLFENTLHTVTFLSNYMVSSEFSGSSKFGQWASDVLFVELERFGAGGGSIKNTALTSKKETPSNSSHGDDDDQA